MKEKITTLKQLKIAVDQKKAVTGKHGMFHRPFPAAFIINMAGSVLLQLFRDGLWIYEKEEKDANTAKDSRLAGDRR